MVKLDFQHFKVPSGISGRDSRMGDARESFADILYMGASGIRAHALAMKIYKSQGAEEYDRTEVSLITRIADEYCTPAFIDGLRKQIKEGGGDESNI